MGMGGAWPYVRYVAATNSHHSEDCRDQAQQSAIGVVVLDPPDSRVDATVSTASCILPESEHAECRAIPNDFAKKYQAS